MASLSLLVALVISTQSGVTPAAVHDLQQQVVRLYADAGVRIIWIDKPLPGAALVTIVPAIPGIPGCESAFGCSVVDARNESASVAYIASGTIWQHELRNPLLRHRMLAYVVAHEIGHLMGLPHSNDRGIMHRNSEWLPNVQWTMAERSALTQVLTARSLLAARLVDNQR